MDMGEGVNWEIEECALSYIKQIAGGNLLHSTRGSSGCSVVAWRGREWGEAVARPQEGNICMHIADSLEGLMPKLKLQYFGHLMRRTDSLEKILMLGKIEARRRRGRQRVKWLEGITDSAE